ncbi:ComF family protein [Elusimicrobium simillimum]|uniref:ComF family protein n=1 Tax=Elusimicrobium simillimum TaxID=3143438 RepID=UPI003C6FD674
MKNFIIKVKNHILNILLPKTCHHCGRDLGADTVLPLCEDCLKRIKTPGPLICRRCGITLPSGGATCHNCRGVKEKKYKCSIIRSGFVFTPEVKSIIHNFKYNEHTYLGKFLTAAILLTFDETKEFENVDIIVPVPLHKLKQRIRGYNQSALIAARLAKNKNIIYDEKLLKRVKFTKSQAKLGRKDREKNTLEAFACTREVKGKIVLVIDDVATTGFTLEQCAIALKKAGAKKVYALTAAREE